MDIASEYRYRNPVVGPGDLVIGISQSGETADTLAAMRLARERGATRARDHERRWARRPRATPTACCSRARASRSASRRRRRSSARSRSCTCSALRLAELRGTLAPERLRRARRRAQAPAALHRRAARRAPSAQVAGDRRDAAGDADFFLYIGRHVGLPVALEGALKLKEISYISTDAYAAGEMKHGPIALLDERDAGRLRGDRLAGARQGRLEHAGGRAPAART